MTVILQWLDKMLYLLFNGVDIIREENEVEDLICWCKINAQRYNLWQHNH